MGKGRFLILGDSSTSPDAMEQWLEKVGSRKMGPPG